MRDTYSSGPTISICGLLALAAVTMAGCEVVEDNPSWHIDGPRVLAVSASPPVVSAAGSTTLSALVVDAGGADVRPAAAVRWRVCNPWRAVRDPLVDCLGDDALEGDELPAATEPGELRLTVPQVLAAFPPPQGNPGDGPTEPAPDTGDACRFDHAFVELPVVVEAAVNGVSLLAIKRVHVTNDQEASQRQNPRIAGLLLDDMVIAPDAVGEVSVQPGSVHSVSAELAPDSLDWVCDDTAEVREPVRVHFYVTAGQLSEPYIDIRADEPLPRLIWTAPESGAAILWLVAVDGDGGADWARFALATP